MATKGRLKYDKHFEMFWEKYPKKVAKATAHKSWKAQEPDINDVLKGLNIQSQSDQWKSHRGKFIPHPATWLNQRRWEDQTEFPYYPDENVPKAVELGMNCPGTEVNDHFCSARDTHYRVLHWTGSGKEIFRWVKGTMFLSARFPNGELVYPDVKGKWVTTDKDAEDVTR